MSPVAARLALQRQLLVQRSAESRSRLHEHLRQVRATPASQAAGKSAAGRSVASRVLLELAIACAGLGKVAVIVSFAGRAIALAQAVRKILGSRHAGKVD